MPPFRQMVFQPCSAPLSQLLLANAYSQAGQRADLQTLGVRTVKDNMSVPCVGRKCMPNMSAQCMCRLCMPNMFVRCVCRQLWEQVYQLSLL